MRIWLGNLSFDGRRRTAALVFSSLLYGGTAIKSRNMKKCGFWRNAGKENALSERTDRLNALARKAKTEGLTDEEKLKRRRAIFGN